MSYRVVAVFAACARSGGLRYGSGKRQPGSLDAGLDVGEDRVRHAFQSTSLAAPIAARAAHQRSGVAKSARSSASTTACLAASACSSVREASKHGDLSPRVQPNLLVLRGGMRDHADRDQVLPPPVILLDHRWLHAPFALGFAARPMLFPFAARVFLSTILLRMPSEEC